MRRVLRANTSVADALFRAHQPLLSRPPSIGRNTVAQGQVISPVVDQLRRYITLNPAVAPCAAPKNTILCELSQNHPRSMVPAI